MLNYSYPLKIEHIYYLKLTKGLKVMYYPLRYTITLESLLTNPYPYILLAYENKPIATYGITIICYNYNGILYDINFTIVESPQPPII